MPGALRGAGQVGPPAGPPSFPVQKLGQRGLHWLARPPTLPRDPVWTRCAFTCKLTEHTHADVADKLKFTETDRNAPTWDYS